MNWLSFRKTCVRPLLQHVLVGLESLVLSDKCLHVFSSVLWCKLRFSRINDTRFVLPSIYLVGGSCFNNVICFYSCILVSITISISYDVCVVEKLQDWPVSLSEQVMFVSFKSYRTGQVSLSEQVQFVSFKIYSTGQVSLSVQVMLVSFKSYRTGQVSPSVATKSATLACSSIFKC
jgi:hypothetical protein